MSLRLHCQWHQGHAPSISAILGATPQGFPVSRLSTGGRSELISPKPDVPWGLMEEEAVSRFVPMFASARAVFEARAERLGMPRVWLQNAEAWVFPNSIGGTYEPSNWSRREWRPALEAAGIQDLHFHDLRHFAASALRDAGMDNKMRSVVIGHADERITDSVYTHISEDQVSRAATAFDPLASAIKAATN